MQQRKKPLPRSETPAVNLRTNVTEKRLEIKLSASHPANIVAGIEINQGTTLKIQPYFCLKKFKKFMILQNYGGFFLPSILGNSPESKLAAMLTRYNRHYSDKHEQLSTTKMKALS
jgi:hypothetical protein